MSTWEARASRHVVRASSRDRLAAPPAAPPSAPLALVGGVSRRRPAQSTVGASIWQTPGGVQSELARINADFNIFQEEFKAQAMRLGYPGHVEPKAQSLVDLYSLAWIPLVREWQKFYADNKGWLDNLWWNHAPEAEQFHAQLVDVRGRAAKAGMQVMSPNPIAFAPSILLDPHKNIVDDAKDAGTKAATDLWAILKIALIAALGVAGLVLALGIVARTRSAQVRY